MDVFFGKTMDVFLLVNKMMDVLKNDLGRDFVTRPIIGLLKKTMYAESITLGNLRWQMHIVSLEWLIKKILYPWN